MVDDGESLCLIHFLNRFNHLQSVSFAILCLIFLGGKYVKHFNVFYYRTRCTTDVHLQTIIVRGQTFTLLLGYVNKKKYSSPVYKQIG